MTVPQEQAKELTELMTLYVDGATTDVQFARLQHLMETSEEARRFFVLSQADCVHLRLSVDLLWETMWPELDALSVTTAGDDAPNRDDGEIYDVAHAFPPPSVELWPALRWEPASNDRRNKGVTHSLLTWIRRHPFMAADLTIVLLIILALCLTPAPQVQTAAVPSGSMLAGKITGTANCRWADGCTPSSLHDPVFIGQQFKLDAGVLEITYSAGAKVILQGPATYQVNSVNSGYLPVGKLTGMVTTSDAKGFTVQTPTATVIDVGTEFGVEVAKTGETTSHVFRGAINLVTMTASGESTGLILSQNASARVERSPEHRNDPIVIPCGAAKPDHFLREEQLLPFFRWQRQNQSLRRAPKMLAFYDFQQRNGSTIVLPNAAPSGGSSLDGTVKNATWCDGPVLGRRALEFAGPSDYVWLNLAKSSDSLTLAAWVYAESLDSDLSGLLMSESTSRPGQVYWGIQRDGSVVCDILGLQAVGQPRIQSTPVFEPGSLKRWTHLAVTYDRPSCQVRFYRDGRLINGVAVMANQDAPIQIGPATIGRWRDDKAAVDGGPRNFRGRISELAILGDAMSPEEVQRMFAAGAPAELASP